MTIFLMQRNERYVFALFESENTEWHVCDRYIVVYTDSCDSMSDPAEETEKLGGETALRPARTRRNLSFCILRDD